MIHMEASPAWSRTLSTLGRGVRVARNRRVRFYVTGSVAFSVIAFIAVVTAFCCAPSENKYPGALVGACVFFLVQWLLPVCRPVSGKLLCPWNWALFVFFLQLVLLPVSLLLFGPLPGVLPFLPSDQAINLAILMNVAAFLTFSLTYHAFARRAKNGAWRNLAPAHSRVVERSPSLAYIGLNGGIGIIGFSIAFGALEKLAEYFSDPSGYLSRVAGVSDKLGLAAGLFLRPFLGICVVMLWCRWLDRKGSRKARGLSGILTLMAILAVCLSNATFNYNRGSVVVPLVAMLAVTLSGPRRVSRVTVVFAGVAVLVVLLVAPFYGAYRSSKFTSHEIFRDSSVRSVLFDNVELTEMLQVYAGAPHFLGFFMEMGHWGANPRWGRTLISSALSSLPILGKSFREESGTAIYNRLIYGQLDAEDQIAPFQGEAFLDFHLPGLLAGFFVLGWVAFRLQRAFLNSVSSLETFIWQYLSIWTFFLIFGGLSVVSQIFVYFCWPFYLYFVYTNLRTQPG